MPASRPSCRAQPPARPKIADYPFTTLHPSLGVVRHRRRAEFVLADLPGLIEGANEGVGLGDRFLGHVERCAACCIWSTAPTRMLPATTGRSRRELAAYGHGLADKPDVVALNKIDALDAAEVAEKRRALRRGRAARPVLPLSGVSGEDGAMVGAVFRSIRGRPRRALVEAG